MTRRLALVTGGTGALGRSICRRLASSGLAVVAVDISVAPNGAPQIWSEERERSGLDIHLAHADVTDFDSCTAVADSIEAELGGIDILINCAGITRDASFRRMDKTHWDAVLTTNLDSVFCMTKQVIDGMVQREFGRIVNISSINGEKGQFGQTNYSAAKAGMHGFSMALAREVARKGVTVNTVSPGYMETELVRTVPPDVLEQIVEQIPVGRLGRTEEVAAVVGFLVSDDASYVTGTNVSANGGQHMS